MHTLRNISFCVLCERVLQERQCWSINPREEVQFNSFPPLPDFSIIYETALSHHFQKFSSFMRQRFPTIFRNFRHLWDSAVPPLDEIFHNLWDNAFLPLAEIPTIYNTALFRHWLTFLSFMRQHLPTIGWISHNLWDSSFPPFVNIYKSASRPFNQDAVRSVISIREHLDLCEWGRYLQFSFFWLVL